MAGENQLDELIGSDQPQEAQQPKVDAQPQVETQPQVENQPKFEEQIIIDDAPKVDEKLDEVAQTNSDADLVFDPDPIIPRKQKVTLTDQVTYDVKHDPDLVTISMPSNFDKETRQALDKAPGIQLADNPEARIWGETINEGLSKTTFNEAFASSLEREDSDFHQYLEQNDIKIGPVTPNFKEAENENLKGERAVLRLMRHTGIGGTHTQPMWHSGFWITFKAPEDSEIVELNRQLVADKMEFGRYSYGLVYSNLSVVMNNRIIDFALAHIYNISLKVDAIPAGGIKSLLSVQDIPSIIQGLVAAMYPKGFQIRRACTSNPEKCKHVSEELVNVTKMNCVDRKYFTPWMNTHMCKRGAGTMDLDSVKRYQEELASIQKRRIVLDEGRPSELAMVLRTPSIAQYNDSGMSWINDLSNIVEEALGVDASDNERNNYMTSQGQATVMRQYNHWVDSIEMGTNVIDDQETIEKSLASLSASAIRDEFLQKVGEYINASAISVVGIPSYVCPKCQEVNENSMSEVFRNVIPVDTLQTFFELITQRLLKIKQR
jgi:hypothetical protein